MILYKYVSFEAGIKIIVNNSIGFTQPQFFNDPFESEASYPPEELKDPIQQIRNNIKKEAWKNSTGILSLTRQPLNPLMWAHYGNEHKGMVIGFDVTCSEFSCESSNFIPAQFGNVIYTDKKPVNNFISTPKEAIEVGGTFHFPYGQLEQIQRLFLYKPACWAYEEEVRVAKCLKGLDIANSNKSGNFSVIEIQNRPLYLLSLKPGTIKEVYVGARSEYMGLDKALELIGIVEEHQPESKLFGCGLSKDSWTLKSIDLVDAANKALKRN